MRGIPKNKLRHMEGVAEYMAMRAGDYGLPADEMYVLGLLHDIGYLYGATGYAVRAQNELCEDAGFSDRLGTEGNLPHMTLFQGAFRANTPVAVMTADIAERLRLSGLHSVTLKTVAYVPDGWWFWLIEPKNALLRMHEFTLGLSLPYLDREAIERRAAGGVYIEGGGTVAGETERMVAAQYGYPPYGYRYAGEAYLPHITIGRSEGFSRATLDALTDAFPERTAAVRAVTCYRMGHNGTHAETLCVEEIHD